MSESPLNLYQVLIEEYNSQTNGPQLPDDYIPKKLAALRKEKRFEEINDIEERQKQINDAMVTEFYGWLHENKVRRSALCLSGGGIRSGTFALGLIQGLARHNLLNKFDYLSTVSGGGYIGSWLTAWIHRQPDGLAGVTNELKQREPFSRNDADPAPISYLREYLTHPQGWVPERGHIGIYRSYLKNLFLNWLIFIPLLIALLIIPRLVVSLTLAQGERGSRWYSPVNIFGWQQYFYGRHILFALGFALGIWALAYVNFNRPSVRETLIKRSRFWGKRGDLKGFLLFCLVPLAVSATFLMTYWAWSRETTHRSKPVLLFIYFGIAFTLLAWFIASLILRRLLHWYEINKLEIVALLVGGVLAGLFFWVISLQRIGNPVIGYHSRFPWTTWTGSSAWRTELYVCFSVPLFLLVFLLGATFFVGVSSFSTRIHDEDREWWSRFGAWVLIVVIGWTVANLLVIFGPIVLLSYPKAILFGNSVSGLLSVLLGRNFWTSEGENQKGKSPTLLAALMTRSFPVVALIFLAGSIAPLSLATTSIIQGLALAATKLPQVDQDQWLTEVPPVPAFGLTGFDRYIQYIYPTVTTPDVFTAAKIVHMNVLHHTSIWFVLVLGLAMFGFGMLLSKVISLNRFSLHAGYRNRLIRAFLGASRLDRGRNPNPFTGFDAADNIDMHELRPGLLGENDLIDPVELARELRNDGQPLSRYLTEKKLLENLNAIPLTTTASPRLTASLLNDLNGVMESERLYTLDVSAPFLKADRIARAVSAIKNEHDAGFLIEGSIRSDYQLLLNRLILEEAYPNTMLPCRHPLPPYKLLHVVNTTLNLVGGANLASQQRKAKPFSISPLHSGCFRLGYRQTRYYGGRDTGGISLGTAAAISGAAPSSNIGSYTTSPFLSLLLTLFNVRLGWWLGNPGPAGDETYDLRAPWYSLAPLIDEAFGLTNEHNKYVYLTDGGHFENLAIYEMVLRRCQIIVVSDGAQDKDYRFTDLANAIRKIRIDLGVPIEFAGIPIYGELPEHGQGMYWAIGRIRYRRVDGPEVKDGVLLYIKPAIYGNEPRDVLEYWKSHPDFPHQSTADQFSDESQFESYRMLGSFIIDQLCGEETDEIALDEVISNAFKESEGGGTIDPDFRQWFDKWKALPTMTPSEGQPKPSGSP